MNPETMQIDEVDDHLTPGTQKCQKLSFSKLKEAINLTHESVMKSVWAEKSAKNHLSRHCLSTNARDAVVECAINEKIK